MNQKWGSREGGLQRLKGIFIFKPLRKRLILLSQTSKRGHYCKIMCNESTIKINEPKRTLNIPNRNWGNPIHNGLNLIRVQANAISKNNITKEFHLRLMEYTFFQFGIKTNFLKLLQNKTYMAFMVCHVLWKNENVIDVTDHKIIKYSRKTSFIICWKTTCALVRPKGITTYSKWS